ncbi:MFS transporter [Vineibacter terrae]|nr:MFS transporter [Vineibacter terrae]HEX2890142.1 MFS transporter [Vineibacter terrae]
MDQRLLIAAICVAQTLSMLGANGYTTLLPLFRSEWQLTNAQAGWIAGSQYFGFMLAVPVLSALTDRFDPRRVVLAGSALVVVTSYAFAYWAEGFTSALLIRGFYGAGFAATYMPGLRALVEAIDDPKLKARATTWYLVSFSTGVALSILVAGQIAPVFGWRLAFGFVAAMAALAFAMNFLFVPGRRKPPIVVPTLRDLFDYRPVLRHKPAMAYIIGQCGHTWEALALVSWMVAYLAYIAESGSGASAWLKPTDVATLAAFAAIPASLLGGELAARIGRRRLVLIGMAISCLGTLCLPWVGGGLGYNAVAVFLVVLMGLAYIDSPAMTASLVANAPEGRAGAAMGLHTSLGFAGGFLGPWIVGVMLDAVGHQSTQHWALAFATVAVAGMMGWLPVLRWGR